MAVLPWGHNRNHTSSSAEKLKASSLEWFARSAAEPSRQAINQLMKQNPRVSGGGPGSLRAHSRAGTPSSQHSSHRSVASVDSRPDRTASVVVRKSTASDSRPATPARPSISSVELSESASRSLFQKGGLLRRKGSKISMNLPTSPTGNIVSRSRPTSRAGLRGRDATVSPTRDDSRRPSISKPFDFAHVMHGDLSSFTGLGSIDETDLASQFDAIQERYRTTTETGSPLRQEPETLTPTEKVEQVRTLTPTPMSSTTISMVPPPVPPPKDSPCTVLPTPTDVRASRSTENFSRPTPRSPTTSAPTSSQRPSSCHLQHLTTHVSMNEVVESTHTKPLPQLPNVIHAVSTEDDTARLLISAPLPAPPAESDKAVLRNHRPSSSRASLRHMSTFPSARHPQTGTSTQEGQLLGIKEEEIMSRPHSDYELSQRTHRNQLIKPDSTPLQVEDWEVAIDSAWDVEDEADLQDADETSFERRESLLTIDQSQPDTASSPSTPLMTMAPTRHPQRSPGLQRSPSIAGESGDNRRASSALVGLGIEADDRAKTPLRASRLPTLEIVTSDTTRINVSPHLTRSAYSAISHASSQESIILSIASSIISTQRSSVSSVSVSEYAHTGKSDRSSVANSSNSPLLSTATQKAARPESSCLPSALLQQMNIEAQKAARPESTCLPSAPASKRSSVVSKADRPESICLPQEMLATFPIPETVSRRGVGSARQCSKLDIEEDGVADLPTDDLKQRPPSAARSSTSRRASSNSNSEHIPTVRRRSSTQNSRPRNVRVSYSLFPNAVAASANAAVHPDSDIVAT